MAAKKIRTTKHSQNVYVHGNTVRKIDPARTPVKRTPVKKRSPAVTHAVRRNREKALHMNLPYVVMLTIAAICTLCICVNYLHLQASITSRIHNIEKIEQKLELMRLENDALETSINTSIDLDHVYQVATQELGMVYANKNQVIMYNPTEREYVRQNEDIPKYKP